MEPTPLVYDAAASAEVWRRVSPALPAYGAPPSPADTPRPQLPGEQRLGALIGDAASLCAQCRACALRAPCAARQGLAQLAREQQRAVRALLAAYYLYTGRWRQPPAPPQPRQEPWLVSLRRVYVAEALLRRDCDALTRAVEDGCLRRLLETQCLQAEDRAKRLSLLLENTLTTANNLLKW